MLLVDTAGREAVGEWLAAKSTRTRRDAVILAALGVPT